MIKEHNVEALLFDLGGVLFEIDFERALGAWGKLSKLSAVELRQRFKMDLPYERHERGEIKAAEYFSHLRATLELNASDSAIASGWNAIFLGEISETVNYITAVNNQIPCYAFTNTNATHKKYWMQAYPRVVDAFQHIFVSSDMGLRKPEQASFDAIAKATDISLGKVLFFDDTEENVSGARAAGLQAVQVKSHSDVKHALDQITKLKQ